MAYGLGKMGKVSRSVPIHSNKSMKEHLLSSWQLRKQRAGPENLPAALSVIAIELNHSPEHPTTSLNCMDI